MYICLCNGFTDKQVRAVCGAGDSAASVYRSLGVRPKCGKCVPLVRQIQREIHGRADDGLATEAFAPA
jgi:bacterioferritin-associated ferredoxin